MTCNVSRFYVCTDIEDCDGYVEDVDRSEADKYEANLKERKEEYLRVDL